MGIIFKRCDNSFGLWSQCCVYTETALHIAVKNKHHIIVSMLLLAGANPNLRVYLPDDEMARLAEDEYIFTGTFLHSLSKKS